MKRSKVLLFAAFLFLLISLLVKTTNFLPERTIKTSLIFFFVFLVMYLFSKRKEKNA